MQSQGRTDLHSNGFLPILSTDYTPISKYASVCGRNLVVIFLCWQGRKRQTCHAFNGCKDPACPFSLLCLLFFKFCCPGEVRLLGRGVIISTLSSFLPSAPKNLARSQALSKILPRCLLHMQYLHVSHTEAKRTRPV